MQIRFTEGKLAKLSASNGRQALTDAECPGLCYSIATSNVRSFYVAMRVGGAVLRRKLGDHGKLTLGQARQQVTAIRAAVEAAHPDLRREAFENAIGDVATERAENERGRPVAEHMRAYLDARLGVWAPSTARKALQLWRADILPSFETVPAGSFGLAVVEPFLDKLPARKHRRVRTQLLAFSRWAAERHLVPLMPAPRLTVARTRAERIEAGGFGRERFLGLHELGRVLPLLEAEMTGRTPDIPAAMLALLATGCRLSEIADANWREVDREARVLTIPAARMKAGQEHRVTLNDVAIRAFNAVTTEPRGPVFRVAIGSNVNRWRMERLHPVVARPFVQHDYRRTMATHLGDLGVAPHIIDVLLAHAIGSRITATYNRSRAAADAARAWHLWGRVIDWLLTGPAVSERFDDVSIEAFRRWAAEAEGPPMQWRNDRPSAAMPRSEKRRLPSPRDRRDDDGEAA